MKYLVVAGLGMVFKTPAMRVRVQKRDDLIANTVRRVLGSTRKWFGEQRARFWPNPSPLFS